nr:enoyl reductase-like protein [Penicillium meliponae]CAG8993146.1 Dehydrogenase [Penicillium sclerotiorum]
MKAAQWNPNEERVAVNEIPFPEPAPNQILIKMASASLCHSDLMSIRRPNLTSPFTLGHEGAGYVYKLGSNCQDKGFKEGDPVGFLYINGCCFECEGCMIHNTHCKNGNPSVAGFGEMGFFQEYAPVDWQNIIHLPPSLDPKGSSAIFCAGITAFHAVDSCDLKPGQWLAVVGAGGLGQLATQYAKAMGFNVVAVDINDKALETCKTQGADLTVNSKSDGESHVDKVKNITQGGVHAAAVFSAASAAYKGALGLIRTGGVLMAIGIPTENIPVSVYDLVVGNYRVKAESTGIPQRMKKAVDFTAEHGIVPQVEIWPSLEDVDQMVKRMQAGESSRRMGVVFD